MCGAYDCEACRPGCNDPEEDEPTEEDEPSEVTTKTTRRVIARKARYAGLISEIRVGDTVDVTKGFTYEVNGPRTGYLSPRYERIRRGKRWG